MFNSIREGYEGWVEYAACNNPEVDKRVFFSMTTIEAAMELRDRQDVECRIVEEPRNISIQGEDMEEINQSDIRKYMKLENIKREKAAKAICSFCPVSYSCIELSVAAQRNGEDIRGIWGGINENQRKSVVRKTRKD